MALFPHLSLNYSKLSYHGKKFVDVHIAMMIVNVIGVASVVFVRWLQKNKPFKSDYLIFVASAFNIIAMALNLNREYSPP